MGIKWARPNHSVIYLHACFYVGVCIACPSAPVPVFAMPN